MARSAPAAIKRATVRTHVRLVKCSCSDLSRANQHDSSPGREFIFARDRSGGRVSPFWIRCKAIFTINASDVVEFAALTNTEITPSSEQDASLLVGLAEGNLDAEQSFERRFRPRFELIARYAGVRSQGCEDVAQDAMLAALSQIKRGLFRNESSWVHGWR